MGSTKEPIQETIHDLGGV